MPPTPSLPLHPFSLHSIPLLSLALSLHSLSTLILLLPTIQLHNICIMSYSTWTLELSHAIPNPERTSTDVCYIPCTSVLMDHSKMSCDSSHLWHLIYTGPNLRDLPLPKILLVSLQYVTKIKYVQELGHSLS